MMVGGALTGECWKICPKLNLNSSRISVNKVDDVLITDDNRKWNVSL